MNPAVQAVICGHRRQQVTQTFTANATWPAPLTTNRIDSAVGKGGAGSPQTSTRVAAYKKETRTYRYYGFSGDTVLVSSQTDYYGGVTPSDYCDAQSTPTADGYTYKCYVFTDASFFDVTPATTGPSTTAFGQTFPGGTGGPASNTTVTNVAITPGASYNIVVPAGGSLTITYYQ
jgi:hypothetical protein